MINKPVLTKQSRGPGGLFGVESHTKSGDKQRLINEVIKLIGLVGTLSCPSNTFGVKHNSLDGLLTDKVHLGGELFGLAVNNTSHTRGKRSVAS